MFMLYINIITLIHNHEIQLEIKIYYDIYPKTATLYLYHTTRYVLELQNLISLRILLL